jgi:transcription antitermination factor NusG
VDAPTILPWYVLRVKVQFERVVRSKLSVLNIEALAPVQVQVRRWSDRTKRMEVVLFPGYVFVQVDHIRREDVFKVGREVLGYLQSNGQPAVLKEWEVVMIKQLVQLDQPVTVVGGGLIPGRTVTISSGPLRGYVGVLKTFSGRHRVLLEIDSLKCVAEVEVAISDVE